MCADFCFTSTALLKLSVLTTLKRVISFFFFFKICSALFRKCSEMCPSKMQFPANTVLSILYCTFTLDNSQQNVIISYSLYPQSRGRISVAFSKSDSSNCWAYWHTKQEWNYLGLHGLPLNMVVQEHNLRRALVLHSSAVQRAPCLLYSWSLVDKIVLVTLEMVQ